MELHSIHKKEVLHQKKERKISPVEAETSYLLPFTHWIDFFLFS